MAEPKEKSILTDNQKKVLEAISKEKYFVEKFYLAGGTALAEFYLKHRLSEDIDLFSEKHEIDPVTISRFFENKSKTLQIKKIETKRVFGLYSFFLHFLHHEILKVDFNYYPFPRIEKGVKFNQLEIESIYDIAVDKVHTVVMKPRARDFVDIYFVIEEKGYGFRELLMQAKAKFDWDISLIDLGARFVEAAKLTDYPYMLKKIDHKKWQSFFLEEAKKLKNEIFE
ncbi:MAG: nucleotidyl transferase AbiEii/AbiGii toxin family protein [Elusimicrobiota bacterium]